MKCLKFGSHFYTNCLKLWISHMKKYEYEFYTKFLKRNKILNSYRYQWLVCKVKLQLLYCHLLKLRPATMGLRDSLNCMQSIAQPIALMSIATGQASGTGRLSVHVPRQDSQRLSMARYIHHWHCHWNSTPQRDSNPVLTSTSQQVAGMRFTNHKTNQDYE